MLLIHYERNASTEYSWLVDRR